MKKLSFLVISITFLFALTASSASAWTYCFQDSAFTPQYQMSLDANNSVRGQAVLAGNPSFPAPIVGEYIANHLIISIAYLESNGLRYYDIVIPSQMQGQTWAVYNQDATFYDTPHAAQLVPCGADTDSNATASGAIE